MSIRKIKKDLADHYRQRRLEADILGARQRQEVRAAYPELDRLEKGVAEAGVALMAAVAAAAGPGESEAVRKAKAALAQSQSDRLAYLRKIGVDPHYDRPQWTCSKCQDEGFVKGKACSCYEQAYLPKLRAYLNLDRLDGMTFAAWRSEVFPNQSKGGQPSQRTFMDRLKRSMEDYAQHFQPGPQANLLFTGATGTGKTFLLGCLANELEQRGHRVLYFSAPRLLQEIAQYRKLKNSFAPDPERLEEAEELHELILHVPCLIIDDLGTEDEAPGTRLSEWLQLLNYRTEGTTLISTNLNRKSLQSMYDERLLSRLLGTFTNVYFPGADIRLAAKYGLPEEVAGDDR